MDMDVIGRMDMNESMSGKTHVGLASGASKLLLFLRIPFFGCLFKFSISTCFCRRTKIKILVDQCPSTPTRQASDVMSVSKQVS